MDVLSDVLSWLRVEGSISRRSELTAPWGIAYPETDRFALMTVEQGRCVHRRAGAAPLLLEAGDLVMAGPGQWMSLTDAEGGVPDTVPYAAVLQAVAPEGGGHRLRQGSYPTLRWGGGGALTVLRGWGLSLHSYEQHPLLALLPPFVHIRHSRRAALPWLDTTLRFLRHETDGAGDGAEMMIVRLVDLLFVQVVRAWLQEQPDGAAGWLGALRDASIRRALQLIHADPTERWTVAALGRAAGMSRSAFSARFGALVGVSPMRYLTQVRMHHAANALRADPDRRICDLAVQVGYDTESSFGRAFKRCFGLSPGAFRAAQRERRRG